MIWIRRSLAFVAAVVVASALGSLASTHFVLGALLDLDVTIGLGDRLCAYGHDIVNVTPLYAAIIAAGNLVAFPAAALAVRWFPAMRIWIFAAAGATAIVAALLSMEALLTIMPIAGARHWQGMVAQGLAGAAGGLLFAVLSRRPAQ